jgi:hypothetical protein
MVRHLFSLGIGGRLPMLLVVAGLIGGPSVPEVHALSQRGAIS